ncbi:hypothetical protein ACU8KH_03591 [Lachancea thermotolerans]
MLELIVSRFKSKSVDVIVHILPLKGFSELASLLLHVQVQDNF